MPSIYLKPDDYAAYGVPNATEHQVIQASAIINGYLDKPDGLVHNDAITAMEATGRPINYSGNSRYTGYIYLSYTPVKAIISAEYNSNQGGIPSWRSVINSSFNEGGQVWLTVSAATDIVIKYIAGWTYAELPAAIKQACASLVLIFQEGFFSGNIKELKAGHTGITWFDSNHGLIDASTQAMLNPYKRVFA